MRIQQFQVSVVDKTHRQLPRSLRDFDVRSFFSLLKISYRQPRIHYEVWVRGQERLIEVGLHFEADKTTNDALRAYFDSRAIEVHAALGPRVEIEQWTNSWSRVHEVVPYESLDEELVERLSKRLAQLITVLEPMLREWQRQDVPGPRRSRKKVRTKSGSATRRSR